LWLYFFPLLQEDSLICSKNILEKGRQTSHQL
jgi:hypothetical protein